MDWEMAFWILIGLLFYVFLGYPGLLFLLAQWIKQPGLTLDPSAEWPLVSLVIPAHNEEKCIQASLENKFQLDYPRDRLEIIVVSDASTDRTAEMVKSFAGQGVRLVDLAERLGTGGAIDAGMAAAHNEIIVTTDANASADPMMVKNLVRHFSDPTIGGVSGDKCIRAPQSGQVAEQEERTYWSYENRLKENEYRVYGSLLICDNVNFAFRKSIFTDPCPAIVGHDFWLALYISRKGYRLAYDHDAVVYETYLAKLEVDFHRKIRVILGQLQALKLFPDILFNWRRLGLAFQLLSHKILRWLAGILMLGALVINGLLMGQPLYNGLLAGQLAFYIAALTGFLFRDALRWKPVKIITYFVSVNLASLVALGYFFLSRKYRKPFWEKARA